jgi:hypothetical protein
LHVRPADERAGGIHQRAQRRLRLTGTRAYRKRMQNRSRDLRQRVRAPAGQQLTARASELKSCGADQVAAWTAAERARLVQWLSFVGTELHELVLTPLLASDSNDERARSPGSRLRPGCNT